MVFTTCDWNWLGRGDGGRAFLLLVPMFFPLFCPRLIAPYRIDPTGSADMACSTTWVDRETKVPRKSYRAQSWLVALGGRTVKASSPLTEKTTVKPHHIQRPNEEVSIRFAVFALLWLLQICNGAVRVCNRCAAENSISVLELSSR